jgi:phospholipid-binding lipoprotein MlaA
MRLYIAIIAFFMVVLSAPVSVMADAGQQDAAIQLAQFEDDEIWTDSGELITDDLNQQQVKVSDPLEGWNRFWFQVNDALYFGVFKPLAQGYAFVIPERPRGWVKNFFENLMYPVRLVGCLLQGKFESAGMETSKFIINSTIGLAGFADLTEGRKTVRPIPTGDEDIGQAFGAWGMGPGPYLVWPVLGPSSTRDTVGYVGEYFITPTTYIHPWYWSVATKSYARINKLTFEIGRYESIVDSSVDPYAAVRDAYLKLRAKKVAE